MAREMVAYLAMVLEANLADLHAAILLQVRPRGVNDRNVVLLVAYSWLRQLVLAKRHVQGG